MARERTERPAPDPGSETTTARAARASRTRGRILDAARRVLAEQGIAGFTTRRVAGIAEVSHGMVHYHFHDKRDLILALVVHARRDWVEPLEELVDGPGTADERMRAVIDWIAQPATRDTLRVHLGLYVSALDDDRIRERVAAEYARWRAPFTVLFRQLGDERAQTFDAHALGDAFATAADGLVQQQVFDPELPTDRILTALYDRLVPGEGGQGAEDRNRR
ncbi:MAG: TetR/AcrR family transcriptional regulator [Actinomycetota bacterium]